MDVEGVEAPEISVMGKQGKVSYKTSSNLIKAFAKSTITSAPPAGGAGGLFNI